MNPRTPSHGPAEDNADLQTLRSRAAEALQPHAKPAGPGEITEETVDALLEKNAHNPTVQMVQTLKTPAQRARAFRLAGFRHERQFSTSDQLGMRRLQDAVGRVLTGLSEDTGADSREISTPTGSGKNR